MANGQDAAILPEVATSAEAADRPRVAPRGWRTLLRVSVRGLLLLILVIGCGMGWIAQIVRDANIQRRAVASIKQVGGWVVYDSEWDEDQHTSSWKPRWPKRLVDLVGIDYLGNVVFINLHDRGTDEVLREVARLKHLRQLHRPGFAVTDLGLAHLGRLRQLQLLSLDDTKVTDAGLAHLKGLSSLKWLKLTRTKVTDAGIAELQKSLPHLQVILDQTAIKNQTGSSGTRPPTRLP